MTCTGAGVQAPSSRATSGDNMRLGQEFMWRSRSPRKFDQGPIGRRVPVFVIRGVHDATISVAQPEREAPVGVVERQRVDRDVPDRHRLTVDIGVFERRRYRGERDRKVRRPDQRLEDLPIPQVIGPYSVITLFASYNGVKNGSPST